MCNPKVSILWLNFNSMAFIDLVMESLRAVADLDYDNYELVVVDNGSTDGSGEVVRRIVEGLRSRIPRVKFIALDRNVGFAEGCNIAFRASDPDSKYVVLLNNDAVPRVDSLRRLVEEMEADDALGSLQGVLLDYDTGLIDNAGGFVDELMGCHLYLRGLSPSLVTGYRYVTYADGAYSIHRVSAILRMNRGRKLFPSELFAYFEDVLLGFRMWSHGFKVKVAPFIAGKHRRSSSFRRYRPRQLYLAIRNHVALMKLSNSRYKNLYLPYVARTLIVETLIAKGNKELASIVIKALMEGRKLAGRLRSQGIYIDMYSAPIIKLELSDVLKGIVMRRFIAKAVSSKIGKGSWHAKSSTNQPVASSPIRRVVSV